MFNCSQNVEPTPRGSIPQLSPIRITRTAAAAAADGTVKRALAIADAVISSSSGQVLTPVRRSARHAGGAGATPVRALLEATEYCYAPNSALNGLQQEK